MKLSHIISHKILHNHIEYHPYFSSLYTPNINKIDAVEEVKIKRKFDVEVATIGSTFSCNINGVNITAPPIPSIPATIPPKKHLNIISLITSLSCLLILNDSVTLFRLASASLLILWIKYLATYTQKTAKLINKIQ